VREGCEVTMMMIMRAPLLDRLRQLASRANTVLRFVWLAFVVMMKGQTLHAIPDGSVRIIVKLEPTDEQRAPSSG
jgi:hypothetical protein